MQSIIGANESALENMATVATTSMSFRTSAKGDTETKHCEDSASSQAAKLQDFDNQNDDDVDNWYPTREEDDNINSGHEDSGSSGVSTHSENVVYLKDASQFYNSLPNGPPEYVPPGFIIKESKSMPGKWFYIETKTKIAVWNLPPHLSNEPSKAQTSTHASFYSRVQTSLLGRPTDAARHSVVRQKALPNDRVWTIWGCAVIRYFRPKDDVYVAEMDSGSICYLQTDGIIRKLKAGRGDRVRTEWGMGYVTSYRPDSHLYEIDLDWRWDDDHVWHILATEKKFDRVSDNKLLKATSAALGRAASSGRALASSSYGSVRTMLATIQSVSTARYAFEEGQEVLTPFGLGTMTKIGSDNSSNTHVVKLKGSDAIAHIQVVELKKHDVCDQDDSSSGQIYSEPAHRTGQGQEAISILEKQGECLSANTLRNGNESTATVRIANSASGKPARTVNSARAAQMAQQLMSSGLKSLSLSSSKLKFPIGPKQTKRIPSVSVSVLDCR